jgi:hypothetical protein
LGYLLPTLDWEEHYDDFIETRYQGIDASQRIMAHLQTYLHPVVARTTVSTTLAKEILLSGPRHITEGLQEWNYENGLMLYKGLVYVPNNEALKQKVIQQFHDNLMGHPEQWKTLELIT